MYPRITVVTVNLNNAAFLEEAIQSVLGQRYPDLEYIIIDGGSTDGSVEIIRKYERHLAHWESAKDEGYGYALQKGFARSTGEIMAWLNSDDVYLPGSLFAVAGLFQQAPAVQWITGFPSWCNKNGFHLAEMPVTAQSKAYWAKRYDLYQNYSRWSQVRYLGGDYLAIQQESTFWRRSLWQQAGAALNLNYKLALDTELWCRFFRYAPLYSARAVLAGFRSGGESQLTQARRKEYLDECAVIIQNERNKLPAGKKLEYQLRFFLGRLLKPGYYFRLPLMKLYESVMKLPPVIEPGEKAP